MLLVTWLAWVWRNKFENKCREFAEWVEEVALGETSVKDAIRFIVDRRPKDVEKEYTPVVLQSYEQRTSGLC